MLRRPLAPATLPTLPRLRWPWLLLLAGAAVATIVGAAPGLAPLPPRDAISAYAPPRVIDAPQIDGVLDDAAWIEADILDDFRQVEPVPGALPAAADTTRVRLAYDATHLYFAVESFDAEPARIVATQRKRDADLTDDDHVILVIDPFLNQRDGYLFAFNPLGARRDALIESGELLNPNWDGLWRVETRRTPNAWIAEGAIPLATISFDPSAPAWGFNVERRIARRGERLRWRQPARQYEVNSLAEAGRLTGLTDLRRGIGLELRAAVSATWIDDPVTGTTSRLKPSLDVFYKLTDATTAVLTLNTDFADAEVDERQVNLTRFPLFFPEKRAFFLQDAGIFSFSLINSSPLPYHSRRIGIGPRGEVVDIVAGLRVSGREGPVNFGVLAVHTDDSGLLEEKDLGVARVQLLLGDDTSVGLIATSGDPVTNGDAWLVGADYNFRTSRLFGADSAPFEGSVWFQQTGATGRDSEGHAYGYEFEYDSRTWGVYSFWEEMGRNYYPALGNVRQTGVWQGNVKVDREFNPARLRRIVPAVVAQMRYNNLYDDREQETFGPEFTAETKRGDTLLLRARVERERLPSSFRVANGVLVQPGDFAGEHLEAALTLSKSRPLAASVSVARRLYYGGHQTLYKNTLTWRPSPMFNLDAAFDYTDVVLPYAHFPVRLIKLGGAVQFSPDLVWSVLGQFDNLSRNVGFNTRVRWTYSDGGDVFFVVNQGATIIDERWDFTRTELSTKVGASWRF